VVTYSRVARLHTDARLALWMIHAYYALGASMPRTMKAIQFMLAYLQEIRVAVIAAMQKPGLDQYIATSILLHWRPGPRLLAKLKKAQGYQKSF
jgi:hypothetical protein